MARPGPSNSLCDVEGISVGCAVDERAATGVTVIVPERRAVCAVDIRGGGRLVYSTPENIGGTQALYSLTLGKGPLQYDWKLGKQSYRLVLERGTCGDGMSDRVYDWKATLTIDGKTERGCAIAK